MFKGAKAVGADRINGVPYVYADNGTPVPKDCLGYVEAVVEGEMSFGNHTFFYGRVTKEVHVSEGEPLTVGNGSGYVYSGK